MNLDYVRPNEEVSVMYFDQNGVFAKIPEPLSVLYLPVKDDKSIFALHYKSKSRKYVLCGVLIVDAQSCIAMGMQLI